MSRAAKTHVINWNPMCCLYFVVCYRRRAEKLEFYINRCLRKIIKIFFSHRITVHKLTNIATYRCTSINSSGIPSDIALIDCKLVLPLILKCTTNLWHLQLLFLGSTMFKFSVLQFPPYEVNTLYMTAIFFFLLCGHW